MKNSEKEQYNSKIFITVRFRDCDSMGHVNNAVYLTYLEQARFQYFQDLDYNSDSLKNDSHFILAEINCRYLAPAKFGDTLDVQIRVSTMHKIRFEFEYLISYKSGKNDKSLIAKARSLQVGFDYNRQRPTRIAADFRERVEKLEKRKFE